MKFYSVRSQRSICSFTVWYLVHLFSVSALGQNFQDSIQEKEVSAILRYLSSDELKGRGNFTPELAKAANFIANRFDQIGLQPLAGSPTFYQPFNAVDSKDIYRDRVKWNGKILDQSRFLYFTAELIPKTKSLNDFKIIECDDGFSDSIILAHWLDTTNTLIWSHAASSKQAIAAENIQNHRSPPSESILFVSDVAYPRSLLISTNRAYSENVLFNVIGALPGKTKPNELVIFSAHYDHIGVSDVGICNGANDDASGTTALLTLAKYFALKNDNQRTILFCAFAGEELGALGSSFLASVLNPIDVTAVINIEMIGKTNASGKKSFFVTGARYSSLERILRTNLSSPVTIYPDPERNDLFERSDNYPFALKGIPAHSIMCSDDNDVCYHKTCDDFSAIDIKNMTTIIRAVGQASQSIIDGNDTPSRIDMRRLK